MERARAAGLFWPWPRGLWPLLFAWLWAPLAAAQAAPGAAPAAVLTEVRAAQRALDAWQLEQAGARSDALCARAPALLPVQLLAAEVLHQRGQHGAAKRMVEPLVTDLIAAGDAAAQPADQLQRLQELWSTLVPTEATTHDFACRESGHFRLCYGTKDEVVATYAEEVLEAAYQNIGAALDFRPAEQGQKIAVEFYPTATALAGATGLHVREMETSGTVAICRFHRLMALSPSATQFGYAWADTLAHEFVHLVVSKKSHNRVPVWLHEGLAKTLESRWRQPRPQPLGAWPEKLLAEASQHNTLVPLARMHPSMAKLTSQREATLAFAEVFDLVRYLDDTFGAQQKQKLLAALGATASSAAPTNFAGAFAQAFAPLAQVEARWRTRLARRYAKHAGQQRYDAQAQAPTPLALAQERRSGPAPASDGMRNDAQDPNVRALLRLGELLQLQGHTHAALHYLEAARAGPGGKSLAQTLRLAQAYTDDGQPQKALQLLDRLAARQGLALDQDDDAHREAWLLYGQLLHHTQQFARAVPYLAAYNLFNPFHPQLHLWLADAWQNMHQQQKAARERHFAALCAPALQQAPD